jgi:hypothetical protein
LFVLLDLFNSRLCDRTASSNSFGMGTGRVGAVVPLMRREEFDVVVDDDVVGVDWVIVDCTALSFRRDVEGEDVLAVVVVIAVVVVVVGVVVVDIGGEFATPPTEA